MKKPLLLTCIIFIIFLSYDTVAQNIAQLKEVKIGDIIWMSENLNVDKFRNGDPILHAKTADEWYEAIEQGKPAWGYYDNDPANGSKFGKLYNWYAVNDPRGLAPIGWRVPNNKDWGTLSTLCGGVIASSASGVGGPKLKSTKGWQEDGNGDNSSGFNGLPGGHINGLGGFKQVGIGGYWWSSNELEDEKERAFAFFLFYINEDCGWDDFPKNNGFSVRCVKE